MSIGIRRIALLVTLIVCSGFAAAQNAGPKPDKDPFHGKLFPPDVILQHREALQLDDEQLAAIRAAVIDVQSNIAGHQWDLRDAYQQVLADLAETPVDEARVLQHVQLALAAENEVKKMQVGMLVRLRNLLTDEQFAYLESQVRR